MKKTLYIECTSGISGDMVLGAYLDLGISPDFLKAELDKLGVSGYRIEVEKTSRYGIAGTRCHVILVDAAGYHHDGEHGHHSHAHHGEHGHAHGDPAPGYDEGAAHHHHHRSYKDIVALIEGSTLDGVVKDTALAIFARVAQAEAKVHQVPVEEVHFHEVGAVDSIVDIVGSAICHHALGAELTWGSAVNVGSGTVRCAHGILPVPAPATAEILAGSDFATYGKHINGEAATPTGVAILAELATYQADRPAFAVDAIGYGFGGRDFGILNALRIFKGHTTGASDDRVTVIDTNVDDMTGEMAGYAMERLLGAGALDVFYTPIQMKKNRPGIRITVLADAADVVKLEHILLTETTTIGIRKYEAERLCMARRFEKRQTPLGEVTYKICDYQDIHRETPEYEDLRRVAQETGLSLGEVVRQIG